MIGFSPRRSLTAHHDWKEVLETLRAKFHTCVHTHLHSPTTSYTISNCSPSVKLPKSFVAINLSEKVPDAFGDGDGDEMNKRKEERAGSGTPPLALDG